MVDIFFSPSYSNWRWCSHMASIHFLGLTQVIKSLRLSKWVIPWWRHQMETFFALLALCAGKSPVTDELPSQRPVARSFDVFFDLRLNKRLSKQSRRRWFETPSRSLWRRCKPIPQQNSNPIGRFWWIVGVFDNLRKIQVMVNSLGTGRFDKILQAIFSGWWLRYL